MNKKIITSLIASSILAVNLVAETYIGVEYGTGTSDIEYNLVYYDPAYGGLADKTTNAAEAYSTLKVKFGAGTDGGFKFEGYLGSISYDNNEIGTITSVVDPSLRASYSNVLTGVEFGINIMKEFEVNSKFYPYIKTGLNLTVSEDWSGSGFNIGGGALFKLNDTLSVYAGMDYLFKDLGRNTANVLDFESDLSSSSNRLVFGLNIAFGGKAEYYEEPKIQEKSKSQNETIVEQKQQVEQSKVKEVVKQQDEEVVEFKPVTSF